MSRSSLASEIAADPSARPAGWWRRLGLGGQLAVWLLVTLRVVLGLVAVLSLLLWPSPAPAGGWPGETIRGGEPWSLFLSSWQRWDALWYQRISEEGYSAGTGTTAFRPLYPLLTWIVSLLLGGHTVWAQLAVASAAFVAAMWLLYRLAWLDVGRRAAALAVLLTAFFPTGFFLLAPYTESLYLALTLAAFWLARAGRPWAAGLAGFGAALTRTVGVFLILPLAFEYLRQRTAEGKRTGPGLLAAGLPGLGLLATLAHNWLVLGERRSPLEAGSLWGQRLTPIWDTLGASWAYIVREGDVVEALNLGSLLGFGLLAFFAVRQLPLAYALYVWPYLGLLFSHQVHISPLASAARYTLVLFPCFIVLALWLARRPWLAATWLVLSALLETLLLIHWVHWGWVA